MEIFSPQHCLPINFYITPFQKQALLDCWASNLDRVIQVEARDLDDDSLDYKKINKDKIKEYGFFLLHNWPSKKKFLKDLFSQSIIDPYLNSLSIQKMTLGIEPHSDLGRTVSLLCILEGDADTVFYQAETFDIGTSYRNRLTELKFVEKHKLELGRFYLFNNVEIHSVENSLSNRIGISIDLTSHFDSFLHAKQHFKFYINY